MTPTLGSGHSGDFHGRPTSVYIKTDLRRNILHALAWKARKRAAEDGADFIYLFSQSSISELKLIRGSMAPPLAASPASGLLLRPLSPPFTAFRFLSLLIISNLKWKFLEYIWFFSLWFERVFGLFFFFFLGNCWRWRTFDAARNDLKWMNFFFFFARN